MATAQAVRAPTARKARRATPRRRAASRKHVAGGAVWIALFALVLAGVVALNVAVLRINLQVDELGRERARLQAENAELVARMASSATAARLHLSARTELGLVPVDPGRTGYVDLGRRRR